MWKFPLEMPLMMLMGASSREQMCCWEKGKAIEECIHIEHFYDELNSSDRYGLMRQTMFTTKSQPKLKGKAAEIKCLGPVMVKVWQKHMNPNLKVHQKILVVLQGS